MRLKILFLLVLFPELVFAESYVCKPVIGAENFKGANSYKIVKENELVYLYQSDSTEHDWVYRVFYEKKGSGFRASRNSRNNGFDLSKLYSIAIGGELTLMDNFQPNEGIKVLVTYANAYAKTLDFGAMKLECIKN